MARWLHRARDRAARALAGAAVRLAVDWSPFDDRWYDRSLGEETAAGVTVGPTTAMKVSALNACVRLIANTTSMLPFPIYRRIDDENRTRDRAHPLHELLNRRPNRWQSAREFRQMLAAHLCLRGNGYARIVPGPRGAVDELVPMHPDCVRPEQLDDLRVVYHVTDRRGLSTVLGQDEVFHLRDLSDDGVLGLSRIEQARQGIGLALAAETYAATYFGHGAEPGTVLTTDKIIKNDVDRERIIDKWNSRHLGPHKAHRTTLLEGGVKVEKLSATNKDSQFLELRGFQVGDIARLYGVPPHLIGDVERATSWGTGIEQQTIGFLTFGLLHWLEIWESAVDAQLVLTPETHFAEHVVAGLLRADFKTRMEAYAQAINWGIYSPDECRAFENRNPRPDGRGGVYLQPANMVAAGSSPTGARAAEESPPAWAVSLLTAVRDGRIDAALRVLTRDEEEAA